MANISITAVCQKCGSKSEINYYQNINVQDSPELKSQVKDGSLFLWTCSKCGSVNLIPFPVLYHDPDEKLMIWYTPESMSDAEKALIDKQINAITEQILSDSNGEILRGYTLRRVKEVGELIEKVNIFDAGLDDVAVEMCKYITRIELSEKRTRLPFLTMPNSSSTRLRARTTTSLSPTPKTARSRVSRSGSMYMRTAEA